MKLLNRIGTQLNVSISSTGRCFDQQISFRYAAHLKHTTLLLYFRKHDEGATFYGRNCLSLVFFEPSLHGCHVIDEVKVV